MGGGGASLQGNISKMPDLPTAQRSKEKVFFFQANNRLSSTNCCRVFVYILHGTFASKTILVPESGKLLPSGILPRHKTLKKRVIVSLPLKLQDTNWYVERGEYSGSPRAFLQIYLYKCVYICPLARVLAQDGRAGLQPQLWGPDSPEPPGDAFPADHGEQHVCL